MTLTDMALTALRNVRRGRSRTSLSVLAVSVGTAAMILIVTLGMSGSKLITNELDRIGLSGMSVFKTNGKEGIGEGDAEILLEKIDEIDAVMPVTFEYGSEKLKGEKGDCLVWGVGGDAGKMLGLETVYGRFPTTAEVSRGAKVAVVETSLASSVYMRDNVVGKTIQISVGGLWQTYEIIGVVSGAIGNISSLAPGLIPTFVYIPQSSLCTLIGSQRIDQLAISYTGDSEIVAEKVLTCLSRMIPGSTFRAEDITGYKSSAENILNLVTLFLGGIGGISLIVAGICIMSTMLASMRERTREIGICMALGAMRREILICFLFEAVIVSVLGGLIGVVCGLGISFAVCAVLNITMEIKPSMIILSALISALCGLSFGAAPAARASRLDPIEALRS